ncbi:hypothetical protein WJX74_007890 [Apatococcus lobatus]|uniref:Protein ENHANCED DISEASE RESISTANCE 2 C-terminal domain-containing protein n=1 Tax=Apatococcus lobatus TaxID=904363 RepID=A0AAW1QLF4_9CHLO
MNFFLRRPSFKAQKSDVAIKASDSFSAANSRMVSRVVSTVGTDADPGLLDPVFYSCPGNGGFKIRGANYLKDKRKVAASEPQFRLASVHLVEVPQPTFDIARLLPNIRDPKADLTFVLQLMVPGPPHLALTIAWSGSLPAGHPAMAPQDLIPAAMAGAACAAANGAAATAAEPACNKAPASPFSQLLTRFLEGQGEEADRRRHTGFKLIPSVVQASWIIKQAVGQKPVLLGQKLTTKYFRGPGYFEVDVDVGSSRSAAAAVSLVSGATKSMVIDMAVLFEGQTPEQLPENLLGTVRFSHLDMKTAPFFDTQTGIMHPPRRS